MSEIKSADPNAVSIAATPARRFQWWILILGLGLVGAAMANSRVDWGALFAGARLHPHLPDLGLIGPQPLAIKIHLAAAVVALLLGAVMMLSRKGRTFHRTAGWIWVCIMALVAGSSLFITGLNGNKWSLIHLLSGWTLLLLPFAVLAARRHKVTQHRRAMMGLFYGGLVIAGALAFIPGRLMWNLFLG